MSGPLRRAAVLMTAVVLAATTSGCAAAARGLLVLDTLATVHDVASADADVDDSADDVPDDTGTAVVDGTGGAGLRLRDEPGGRRIALLTEGAVVRWTCRRSGPGAAGPRGRTDQWALVTTDAGVTGFASGAYLRGGEDVSELPLCSPGRG